MRKCCTILTSIKVLYVFSNFNHISYLVSRHSASRRFECLTHTIDPKPNAPSIMPRTLVLSLKPYLIIP